MPALRALGLFTPTPGQYENIHFDASNAEAAGTCILAVCIGVILAALYNFYVRSVPGGVVRALLAAEALSCESAKSVQELGLSRLAAFELTHNAVLRRLILSVTGEEGDEVRYYIPEEQKYRAEVRFESRGNGVVGLLITAVVTLAAGLLVSKLLPWFLGIIDKFL